MTVLPQFESNIGGVKLIIRNNGFVELHYPEDLDIDLKLAQEIDKTMVAETHKTNFFLLLNFQNSFGNMSNEVQNYFAKEAGSIPQIKAASIVINNLPIRILAKFYIRFFRPIYPMRIFSDMELAKDWLTEKYNKDHISESDKNHKSA